MSGMNGGRGMGGGDQHELCLLQMKKLARRHQQQQEQQNSQRLGQGEVGPGPQSLCQDSLCKKPPTEAVRAQGTPASEAAEINNVERRRHPQDTGGRMAGWAGRRGGGISGIKVIHSQSPGARHRSHRLTLSRSLNPHSSPRGRALSCPVSQMRRLRLRVAKGPVMITQLVEGKAGPQSHVWGAPELCFHHGRTPRCPQQNPAEKAPEEVCRVLRSQGGLRGC